MNSKLEKIITELIEKKMEFKTPQEIEAYIHTQAFELDNSLTVKILERLVEDYIWDWLEYIGYKLPQVASTDPDFLELLVKIVQKLNASVTQGPFIEGLISIGSKDPLLGFKLSKLLKKGKKDLSYYAAFPLGGAGRREFEGAFNRIKKGFKTDDSAMKATCIRALPVIFKQDSKLKKPSEIFELLKKASDEKEEVILRKEVVLAYVDFYRFKPDECFNSLVKLAKQDNSDIRLTLAARLELKNSICAEDQITLLKICALDNSSSVQQKISANLASLGKEHPEDALQIFKAWIKQRKPLTSYDKHSLRVIGSENLERCIKYVESWIGDPNARLRAFIPKILVEVGSSNYELVLKAIKPWIRRNSLFKKWVLDTLKRILCAIFPNTGVQKLINSCLLLLKEMVGERRIDVKSLLHGEPDEFYQCFILIEELEVERPNLDYERIFKRLKTYPHIRDFLTAQWFKEQRIENNKTHPLLIKLSSENPTKETTAFLTGLEGMLRIIMDNSTKLRDLRKGLQNKNQFWQTISEIEVISLLMREHPVIIAPEIAGKKADAKSNINGIELLLEITTPDMVKSLKYLIGKGVWVKNRARNKIYDEFKDHFKHFAQVESRPVLIVIDISRSEIDCKFVEDYLEGSSQVAMLVDKTSKEVVQTYPTRAKDYMHVLDPETSIISGILCYRRPFEPNGKFRFKGRLIPNKFAKNPLSPEIIQKINRLFFNDW